MSIYIDKIRDFCKTYVLHPKTFFILLIIHVTMQEVRFIQKSQEGKKIIETLSEKRPLFIAVISNTMTAEIPGITVAGENPDLIKYTPPADAELLYYGKCKSIPGVPATPDGKPTPALMTYSMLRTTKTPFFVVESGCIIKPKIPYLTLEMPPGNNISEKSAMDHEVVRESMERSEILGKEFSKICDFLVIGESIPGGTTTALAVLRALGVESFVSSSMPENPTDLKKRVVADALKRENLQPGDTDPMEALVKFGDPMMVATIGLVKGSNVPVVLAGGTQMATVGKLLESIDKDGFKRCILATTIYVAEDESSDITSIVDMPMVAVDPGLDASAKPGLRAYSEGFVKEGVGAGGSVLLALLSGLDGNTVLKQIEKEYTAVIEKGLQR